MLHVTPKGQCETWHRYLRTRLPISDMMNNAATSSELAKCLSVI
jgi:hypothetical protein